MRRIIFSVTIGVLILLSFGIWMHQPKPTQDEKIEVVSQPSWTIHFKVGTASWYSNKEYPKGALMANGEEFRDDLLTCASWDYDIGTWLKVTEILDFRTDGEGDGKDDDDPKSVVVQVTDRGPAKYLVEQGRIIDLSKAAFARIADLEQGLAQVHLQEVIFYRGE